MEPDGHWKGMEMNTATKLGLGCISFGVLVGLSRGQVPARASAAPNLSPVTEVSQDPSIAQRLLGFWRGKIGSSDAVIEMTAGNNSVGATLYDLSNESAAVVAASAKLDGLALQLSFPKMGAELLATFQPESELLDARWQQAGQQLPLKLVRSELLPSVKERRRCSALGMNPLAPLATGQFAFLLGEWHGTNKKRPGTTLVWKGGWILEGMALQNTSKTSVDAGLPSAGAVHQWGVDTRIFSRQRGLWQHTYTSALTGEVMTTTWKLVGEDLISDLAVWNEAGKPTTNIIKFRDITEDSFVWSADRSFDGGETWVEDFIVIENRRVPSTQK